MAGTTGYEFMRRVTGLFVDPAGEKPLTDLYVEFTGEPTDYGAVVREKQRLVLRQAAGGGGQLAHAAAAAHRGAALALPRPGGGRLARGAD